MNVLFISVSKGFSYEAFCGFLWDLTVNRYLVKSIFSSSHDMM